MGDLDPYVELKSDFKRTKSPPAPRISGTPRPETVETRVEFQYIDPHATLHELQWFVARLLIAKGYFRNCQGGTKFLQATGQVWGHSVAMHTILYVRRVY